MSAVDVRDIARSVLDAEGNRNESEAWDDAGVFGYVSYSVAAGPRCLYRRQDGTARWVTNGDAVDPDEYSGLRIAEATAWAAAADDAEITEHVYLTRIVPREEWR